MLLLLVYGLFLVVAALWLLRAAVYLVPAGCSGSSAGWVSGSSTGRSIGALRRSPPGGTSGATAGP